MSEKGYQNFITKSIENQEEAMELMEKLFDAAEPDAVYSEPVVAGEYTVITACEISVGLGFGYGLGGGSTPPAPTDEADEADETDEADEEQKAAAGFGFGGGGGGGGASAGRPVAVISVGPNGVSVEPIIDVSKLAIAFLTTLLSIFMMGKKMRKAARKHK